MKAKTKKDVCKPADSCKIMKQHSKVLPGLWWVVGIKAYVCGVRLHIACGGELAARRAGPQQRGVRVGERARVAAPALRVQLLLRCRTGGITIIVYLTYSLALLN